MTESLSKRWIVPGLLCLIACAGCATGEDAADYGHVAPWAQQFRQAQPVTATADGSLFLEGEEFQVLPPGAGDTAALQAWQAKDWGENYFAATLANTFLSRKAFLGAPPQCRPSRAIMNIDVPADGRYLVLARYETAYRFETQFRIKVEQDGHVIFDRLYGARDNLKVWPFANGLKKEVSWSWGAVENIVWEGHDAFVELNAGPATVALIANKQPEPAANRNVDVVVITPHIEQVLVEIQNNPRYLPLDGLLTQEGDVFLKVHNAGQATITATVPNGTEHSPYWIHQRKWKPETIEVAAGAQSDWIEVGSQLDSLNDGQWVVTTKAEDGATLNYGLDFGLRSAAGEIEPIKTIASTTEIVRLAYDANTRYTRRIRSDDQVLYDLLDYVRAHPVPGHEPKRSIVYATTFAPRPDDAEYTAARDEFIKLMGITTPQLSPETTVTEPAGLTWRSEPNDELEEHLKAIVEKGLAEQVRTVSFGDEIGLSGAPSDSHEAFREWARQQGLQPNDVDPNVDGWQGVKFSRADGLARTNPRLYYWSRLYNHHRGIEALKMRTEIVEKYLPNAGTGANFSPHGNPMYVGEAHKWITLFRRGAMTQPWSEDYIWQVPVGSQQMNFLNMDLFRAGNRYHPDRDIHFYVMPHWPGNRPDSWRRQFYGCLGSGMTIANLFEFRPVQAAYTENHVTLPEMYVEVRRAIHELGTFEDIVQDGHVRWGNAGLWFSDTADVWNDQADPYAPNKRSLYVALRHQQLALDVIDEDDAKRGTLDGYDVIFLTDHHVSSTASKLLVQWVRRGGRLVATAGGGMFNEYNQPNQDLRALFGIDQVALDQPDAQRVRFGKQDLPFTKAMDTVSWLSDSGSDQERDQPLTTPMPVIGARSRVLVHAGNRANAHVAAAFRDGSPAITFRRVGDGRAVYVGFLPGLTYFKPAIPLQPVDRSSSDNAMCHFVPTEFDPGVQELLQWLTRDVARPVVCSNPLVQASVIESPHGVAIALVNWSDGPVKDLEVTVNVDVSRKTVRQASGKPVKTGALSARVDGKPSWACTLDLDVADALIFE